MRGYALRKKVFIPIFFGLAILSSSPQSLAARSEFCLNPGQKPNDYAPNRGANFLSWDSVGIEQRNLLESFFGTGAADTNYTQLAIEKDGEAATFLAVTNALDHLTFSPGTSEEMSGLDLLKGIKEIRTDRLIVYLDVEKIKSWMNSTRGSSVKYSLSLNSGGVEKGQFKFYNHSTLSAGLHCGYDLQWYTKPSKAPHLHWNVRFSDGQADVHLDGYSPWIDYIIPNPRHLTYANSDVRYWYKEYVRKYGNPGFITVKKFTDGPQE